MNERDEEGFSPLHYAAWTGDNQVVQNLLNLKADVNCKNKDNKTPLHLACTESRLESALLLLNNGADVNSKDKMGYTPLHCASEANWGVTGWEGSGGKERPVVELCSLLLSKGADPLSADVFGRTPLDVSTNNQQVKDILKSSVAQRKRKKEEERRASSTTGSSPSAPSINSLNEISPLTWTVEQVCGWVESIGFPQYCQIFREKMINGKFLINKMDEAKLSKLVTDDFHSERIMDELTELKSSLRSSSSNLVVPHPVPEKSVNSTTPAKVTFDNNYDGDIRIYWVDLKGEAQLKRILQRGETYQENTYVGHVWRMMDDKTGEVKANVRVSQEVEWFNVDQQLNYHDRNRSTSSADGLPSYSDVAYNEKS